MFLLVAVIIITYGVFLQAFYRKPNTTEYKIKATFPTVGGVLTVLFVMLTLKNEGACGLLIVFAPLYFLLGTLVALCGVYAGIYIYKICTAKNQSPVFWKMIFSIFSTAFFLWATAIIIKKLKSGC
jgi:hypothetical protein